MIRFLLYSFFTLCMFIRCNQTSNTSNIPSEEIQDETSKKSVNSVVKQDVITLNSNNFQSNKVTSDNERVNIQLKQEISALNTDFHYAVISPDGKFCLVSYEGYVGLEIYDVKTAKKMATIHKTARIGYGATWSADSKKIYYKEKNPETKKTEVKEFILQSSETNVLPNIHPSTLQSFVNAKEKDDPIIVINPKTLAFEIHTLGGDILKAIQPTAGGGYYQPLLSPDKSTLIVHSGSKMYWVNVQTFEIKEIQDGIATSWFPDSKHFLYFLDESKDGHEITGSDIYLYNIETRQSKKITHTNQEIEMWPQLTNDGKMFSCVNARSGKVLIYSIQL